MTTGDEDWAFSSGNTIADPAYHIGPAVIGRAGTTTHHLDVDNGNNTGTQLGLGDVEYFRDGNNITLSSSHLIADAEQTGSLPTQAGNTLGSASHRWRRLFSVNGITTTSDGSLKEKITPSKYGLETLMELEPISYFWKDEKYLEQSIPANKRELQFGFKAQQLLSLVPEVVVTHDWVNKDESTPNVYKLVENETLGVKYNNLLPLLVKAKQEQDTQLKKLMQETLELEEQLNSVSNEK